MAAVACAPDLTLSALAGVPRIGLGDDVAARLIEAMRLADWRSQPCDVLVVASKLFSRAQGRWMDLSKVRVSEAAQALAEETHKDPGLVQCILDESSAVSRKAPGVLIVRHRLGFVSANAGIDASNALPAGASPESGPWVLLLPRDPNADARNLRDALQQSFGGPWGVVISDSHGRPFRQGSVGTAIGVAGLPPLFAQVGHRDLDGRPLQHTVTALADQVATAADLVAGQADESRPAVRVRGLTFEPCDDDAAALLRPAEQDLYA